ncbi:host specificity protein J [Dyella caseinilytica]|uniref:Host specificity protein J n=1 Tax=Dyella caseinilytica TaxID=1849581 RepID=A0ABX7GSY4_9GAMM|nr:host specificity protein J [Dyella caseinilytica]QRN52385.1 host specificity protein J [Dyella caseinilytica]GGA05493.1 host specificity protein [Dyella caseinilytica]
MLNLQGFKGSSGQHTPVESPDNLRSIATFRIVDLIGEGEIGGLVNGLQSVYLAGTPLANPDGSLNFSNVSVTQRTGTQDQDYIPGFASVENAISLGIELKSETPWVQAINNLQLSAVSVTISTPALSKIDTSTGDVSGYSVAFRIEVQSDGGAYQLAYNGAITGKTTTKYQRSIRVDLPPARLGWSIRVTRTTANANSSSIADTTTIDSYTEIVDGKFAYPNSALIGITGDASQFSSIPPRAYDMWGRIVLVPSNYDPQRRTYSGVWDGTFKPAWTNNPAWAYYDLVTNPRFGLGHLITQAQVNKWTLYQIAQYCDQLVPDGKGGQEPRFTLNVFLQTANDAYKLLSDLASVFRGISYWMGGSITASADMPGDPTYVYTAANVINGKFTYSASSRKTRYTTALVTWNDPANAYQQAQEYVQDDAGLARYGIQPTQVSAFGCTSQGQAQRAGKWILLTSQLETDTVTFDVGLDGMIASPGQIIRIADPFRAGLRQGGRISRATINVITLDRPPGKVAQGDTLTCVMPSGVSETQTVVSVSGRDITVTPFSVAPNAESVWTVESASLSAQTFKVIGVKYNNTDTEISFTITALQHNASKFAAIDNGTQIQIPPISQLPASVQPAPSNVHLSSNVVTMQGIATNVMTIAWDAAPGAVQYQVDWRKDSGEWVSAGRVSGQSVDVQGIYTGSYIARVYAINVSGVTSLPALSPLTDVLGKTGAPPLLTSLTAKPLVFGIALAWGFPPGADDTQRTEIWYSASPQLSTAQKLGDFAYPQASYQMLGLAAGVSFFFWGRMVDRTGNIGPFYPTGNGVNGQSSSDAGDILTYLAGQIGQTQLAQDVLAPIQALTPPMAGDAELYAGDDTHYAGVWSQMYAQQEGDAALAGQIDTVAVKIDGFDGLVQTEAQARIDGDTALSTQITTVQATAGDAQALAQTTSTAVASLNGKVSASYQIKVQIASNGQYYAAGMAIGVDNSSGVAQSQILFQADRFALINVNNNAVTSPFVIQNGQTFISQAYIQDGTITNAKIGGVIQSTAVDPTGNPVWSIDKNGSMTMRGGAGGAYRTERDGNGARLYDGNGTLRMRWGAW